MSSSTLTERAPDNWQYIEKYGPSGFRVSGVVYSGSILVRPEETKSWAVLTQADITHELLMPLLTDTPRPEIILLGCGTGFVPADKALRLALKEDGVAVEAMDTGAACRTYNVLILEGRRVAAALITL